MGDQGDSYKTVMEQNVGWDNVGETSPLDGLAAVAAQNESI